MGKKIIFAPVNVISGSLTAVSSTFYPQSQDLPEAVDQNDNQNDHSNEISTNSEISNESSNNYQSCCSDVQNQQQQLTNLEPINEDQSEISRQAFFLANDAINQGVLQHRNELGLIDEEEEKRAVGGGEGGEEEEIEDEVAAADENQSSTFIKEENENDRQIPKLPFGRIDYELPGSWRYTTYLNAMTSHTSYWGSADVALFVLESLFPGCSVTEN